MAPNPDPLRAKILLKSRDGNTTFHTYDSFNVGAADINITSCDVTIGTGRNGNFTLNIEDSGGSLSSSVKNGIKVEIFAAKESADIDLDASRLITGFVRRFKTHRDGTNTLGYTIQGYGSQKRFNERITNYFRFANRDSFGSASPASDADMRASALFEYLVENTNHLPIGGPAESFTTVGVDTISEQLPSIKEPFVEWSHVAHQLANAVGARWGVDAAEDAFFRYAISANSGITIKDTVAADDNANTAYFVGPWNYEDSIEKTDGFSNRLYGRGGSQLHVDRSQTTDAGTPATLLDTDRAQAFTPHAPNLDVVELKLSKVGTLSEDIDGEIVLDDNNDPTGDIVASFKIPKGAIGDTATNVKATIQTHGNAVQVDKKLWIILKENGTDVSNRAMWHHDNGSDGNSASRTPGGSGAWTVTDTGVDHCFVTLCSRRVLNEASSSTSIDSYGVIESVEDLPWIIEGRTMDHYLTARLEFTSKQIRTYDIPLVKAPDALFVPGKLVSVFDTKAGVNTQAELIQAQYTFDAQTHGIGTNYVRALKLKGYVP